MNYYKNMTNLLPIIYPRFCTVTDVDGNEFVRLLEGDRPQNPVIRIQDKTQYEATFNHFHLNEGRIGRKIESAKEWGVAIAQNLAQELKKAYPDKKFRVFLTINSKDMIVRFHQEWENEPPYYDITATYADHTEVLCF